MNLFGRKSKVESQKTDQKARLTNQKGGLINQKGELIEQKGELIEQKGESIEQKARKSRFSGYRRSIFASRLAFTLIEIMIVVAIIGIIMTMGVPSIVHAFKKEGMRKAVGDLMDACNATRAASILGGTDATLTIHPQDGTISGGGVSKTLPENVAIETLGVNFVELKDADEAKVIFHKNGTCDEFTIVLTSADQKAEKISLEVVTGLADVEVLK